MRSRSYTALLLQWTRIQMKRLHSAFGDPHLVWPTRHCRDEHRPSACNTASRPHTGVLPLELARLPVWSVSLPYANDQQQLRSIRHTALQSPMVICEHAAAVVESIRLWWWCPSGYGGGAHQAMVVESIRLWWWCSPSGYGSAAHQAMTMKPASDQSANSVAIRLMSHTFRKPLMLRLTRMLNS